MYFRRPAELEPTPQEQRQAQILQAQLSPHELAYQESLIQEREAEIREIETGIHELAEIFHDLGTLVNQQGGMLGALTAWSPLSEMTHYGADNIELNISSVAQDTGAASEELRSAAVYQRKAGRRALCLMIVLVIVVAVVLLAVGSHFRSPMVYSYRAIRRFYLSLGYPINYDITLMNTTLNPNLPRSDIRWHSLS
jgi:hypothetical protein